MNCGAKLPVFALLTAAFFSANQTLVMLLITVGAWTGALLVAKLLRGTVIKGPSTPFVMELPPYRLPTFKGLWIHTWERTWQYIKKAGTVILGISILLWSMMTFPQLPASVTDQFESQRQALITAAPSVTDALDAAGTDSVISESAVAVKDQLDSVDTLEAETALKYAIAGRIGIALESISSMAGFDWRTNIALVGGFAAKEVVVSTLGTAYSLGEVDPEESDSFSGAPGEFPGLAPPDGCQPDRVYHVLCAVLYIRRLYRPRGRLLEMGCFFYCI